MRSTQACLGLLALLVACGGNDALTDGGLSLVDAGPADGKPDAPPPRECWPVDQSTPGGTIEIGYGPTSYIPMGDEVPLVFGPQAGYHIPVRTKITGLVGGNAKSSQDPMNPWTRARAFDVETAEPINPTMCGATLGYENVNGELIWAIEYPVMFDPSLDGAQLFGRQYRVVVEIIDINFNYATAEKVVTAREPTAQ